MPAEPYSPLSEREMQMIQRLFSQPDRIPRQFWDAVKKKIEADPPSLLMSDLVPGNAHARQLVIDVAPDGSLSQTIRWVQTDNGAVLAETDVYGSGDHVERYEIARAGADKNAHLVLAAEHVSGGVDKVDAKLAVYHYGAGTGTVNKVVASATDYATSGTEKIVKLVDGDNPSDLTAGETTPWVGLSFGTNWADLDASHLCQYRKDIHGEIHLRGIAYPSAVYGYPVLVGTIGTGYRPAQDLNILTLGWSGAVGRYESRYIAITTDGKITLWNTIEGGTDNGAVGNWVSLDNISFMTN